MNRDITAVGIDICSALELLHSRGIIHGWIRLESIYKSKSGQHFKLGDIDNAIINNNMNTATLFVGRNPYMPPEFYRGEKCDKTGDIYSLGMILYRLLNNSRLPFMPNYPLLIRYVDNESSMRRRLDGEKLPYPCNAQDELGDIVLKACSFDPNDRYHSAEEMKCALESFVRKS